MNHQGTLLMNQPPSLGGCASSASSTTPEPSRVVGRSGGNSAKVRRAIEWAFELPDGYTLQMADQPGVLTELMELLVPGRVSLQLSRVEVTVDAEEGLSWVRIRGSREVKAFLDEKVLGDKITKSQGGRS